jgi:hypothetical protein
MICGENTNELDQAFRQNWLHNLTILAYLTDKAEAERLALERQKLLR